MQIRVPGYKVFYPEEMKQKVLLMTKEILDSGSLVLGKYTKQFEESWAKLVGKKHGVAVSSDSAALEMVLRCVGVEGKFVILPAVSFFGDLIAIKRAGGIPKLVDVEIENGVFPRTEQIKTAVEKFEKEGTIGAVLAVFTAGNIASDLQETVAYLRSKGIPCIEDSAHCHGTKLNGRWAGGIADFGCFSFFATKVLTTGGEGGLIVTDNDQDADYLRKYRNYGRGGTWGSGIAAVEGYNWRMTEFQAAVGVELLNYMPEYLDYRKKIVGWYRENGVGGLVEAPEPKGVELGYYRYIGMLPENFPGGRDAFKTQMLEKFGVQFQGEVYETGLNDQPLFKKQFEGLSYPVSKKWCDLHICLPIHQWLVKEQIVYACESIRSVLRGSGA